MERIDVIDGKGYALRSGTKHELICCDCGLVHSFVVKVSQRAAKAGWFGLAMKRDNRRTQRERSK